MARKKRTIKRSSKRTSSKTRDKGRRSTRKGRASTGDSLMKRIKKGQQQVSKARSLLKTTDNIQLWRPKDGQHIIDIVPYEAGPNDPQNKEGEQTYTFEAWVHRGVGPNDLMFICPAETFKEDCPICEHRQTLRERGADDKVWKAMFPKRRNLYNILCYDSNEERKGVQVWEVPYFYAEKNILAIASEPQRGGGSDTINFPHAEHGKSISFTIEPPQSKEDFASYVGWKFLDRDYSIDEDTLDETQTLDQLANIIDYEKLSEIYYGSKTPEEKTEEDMGGSRKRSSGGGSRRSRREKEPEPEEEAASMEDLMDELDECEDLDDLEEFARNYDFDVKITNKSRVRKVKRELEQLIGETEEEEEAEGEPEEETEKDYAYGDIVKMKRRALIKLIEAEDLDVDPDDAEDLEDLRQMIAEELDIPF